jgi:hypothetical protein
MAIELPISVGASEYCRHRLSLRDRKRQFNGFEYFESMHLLAPAIDLDLTPLCCFMFVAPEVSQKSSYLSSTPYDLNCVDAP